MSLGFYKALIWGKVTLNNGEMKINTMNNELRKLTDITILSNFKKDVPILSFVNFAFCLYSEEMISFSLSIFLSLFTYLPISRASRKHGARIRSPLDVTHRRAQLEHKEGLAGEIKAK